MHQINRAAVSQCNFQFIVWRINRNEYELVVYFNLIHSFIHSFIINLTTTFDTLTAPWVCTFQCFGLFQHLYLVQSNTANRIAVQWNVSSKHVPLQLFIDCTVHTIFNECMGICVLMRFFSAIIEYQWNPCCDSVFFGLIHHSVDKSTTSDHIFYIASYSFLYFFLSLSPYSHDNCIYFGWWALSCAWFKHLIVEPDSFSHTVEHHQHKIEFH